MNKEKLYCPSCGESIGHFEHGNAPIEMVIICPICNSINNYVFCDE